MVNAHGATFGWLCRPSGSSPATPALEPPAAKRTRWEAGQGRARSPLVFLGAALTISHVYVVLGLRSPDKVIPDAVGSLYEDYS